jgi:hypothetical protein
MNRQRGQNQVLIRVPPSEREVSELVGGWAEELRT